MGWNYRIIGIEHEGEISLQIHEVYYDADGIPTGFTSNPTPIYSEGGLKGLEWQLDKMREALDKPILSMDNFPKEFKI